uniref:Uncharacterized protein n=1 Tax=Manihot esculenta TaxID=3983 RepID=A0A2C9UAF3_MANES
MRIWTACGCICPNVALVLGIEEENGPQLTSLAGHFYGHKVCGKLFFFFGQNALSY